MLGLLPEATSEQSLVGGAALGWVGRTLAVDSFHEIRRWAEREVGEGEAGWEAP